MIQQHTGTDLKTIVICIIYNLHNEQKLVRCKTILSVPTFKWLVGKNSGTDIKNT